ncbi:MAG: hypothetical protein HY952_10695 [Elusimicrobia bacterium]|nr:hypothetical protein [Elusimicrobiota bacterium]
MHRKKLFIFFLGMSLYSSSMLFAQGRDNIFYDVYNSTSAPAAYRKHIGVRLKGRERFEKRKADRKAARQQAVDPAFKLGKVYAYPNPAVGVKHPAIHIESGLADKVEIKIYSPAGALLEEAVITDTPKIMRGVYAYEYRFASDNTPSGTCSYQIRAYKTGETPLEASGSLVFVRMGQW